MERRDTVRVEHEAVTKSLQGEIVDVAVEQFLARGYDRVSLGDIARAAGLYTATVRLYFRDKEALYLAIVLRGMCILNAMYRERSESEESGIQKLCLLGQTLIEFSRRYPDYYRLLYCSSQERPRVADSDNARAILDIHDNNLRLLYGAIEECMQDGAIRCDLGPSELVLYLIVLTIGLFRIDPGWRLAIESGGIDYDRFARDFPGFTGMLLQMQKKDGSASDCCLMTVNARDRPL